jgi:putrescine aminotransferase
VICGFGRTGHWFGSEYFNIKPDLMPIAKGLSSGYLPIGGVMVSDRIADVIIGKGKEFAHGFTYSGHPAACVVASRNLEIIEREGLVEKVRNDTGPYLRQLWEQFTEHPLVGEVRNLGLLGAIELVDDKSSRSFFKKRGKVGERCRDLCIRNGLVMRAVQDTMILSPPLVATRGHLDEIYEKASKTLNQLAEELGRC